MMRKKKIEVEDIDFAALSPSVHKAGLERYRVKQDDAVPLKVKASEVEHWKGNVTDILAARQAELDAYMSMDALMGIGLTVEQAMDVVDRASKVIERLHGIRRLEEGKSTENVSVAVTFEDKLRLLRGGKPDA